MVIEAGEKSGSLITVGLALEEGKTVFALPGSVFSKVSKGTNKLIKDGATLIDSADDILAHFNIQSPSKPSSKAKDEVIKNLVSEEAAVYAVISQADSFVHPQKLYDLTNLPPSVINASLTTLELNGLIENNLAGKWKIAR